MAIATLLARYSAIDGALANGFTTAELHHHLGHDLSTSQNNVDHGARIRFGRTENFKEFRNPMGFIEDIEIGMTVQHRAQKPRTTSTGPNDAELHARRRSMFAHAWESSLLHLWRLIYTVHPVMITQRRKHGVVDCDCTD